MYMNIRYFIFLILVAWSVPIAVFGDKPSYLRPDPHAILFVGDIMMGRSVETRMKEHGAGYPFSDIKDFFKAHSVVVANLEGPIRSKHVQTPISSMHFSFLPSVAKLLKDNGVTHVTLANNHTHDEGSAGLKETRDYLSKAGVKSFGDPTTFSDAFSTTVEGDNVLLGLHATRGMPSEKIIREVIARVRTQHHPKHIIVVVHWGTEYRNTASNFQKTLGHRLIDAGADMIVGHHPHVIETIERYKGKLIVYSLGNFIFDQYFSKETQQGLALEVNPETLATTLIPIAIPKSKPHVMAKTDAQKILNGIAKRSDPALSKEIARGHLCAGNCK